MRAARPRTNRRPPLPSESLTVVRLVVALTAALVVAVVTGFAWARGDAPGESTPGPGRRLRVTCLRCRSAGRSARVSSSSSRRAGFGSTKNGGRADAVSRHREPGRHGGRARPPLDGFRTGLRGERPLLRLLHGQRSAGHARGSHHRRIPRSPQTPTRRSAGPDGSLALDPTPARQPQRRPAAVRAGRLPLHRDRRRRRRRRPGPRRPGLRRRCSASSCGSTRAPSGAAPYTIPPTTPSSARRRARGDLGVRAPQPVALLVRPPDWRPRRSATSGRTPGRRSTSRRRRGRGRGVNFGWRLLGGPPRLHGQRDEPECRPAPSQIAPVHEYSHSRGCSITRRLRRPRSDGA